MGLSENFMAFGIHSLVPYRRADKLPYGIFEVLAGGTISLSAEFEDLFGGSSRYMWASEAKTISAEFSATVKTMPDFLFELYLGADVTNTAASALGTVDAFANFKGLTILDAVTGIATATAKSGSEGDLKTGIYTIVAVSATTVDIYDTTNIDFNVGTNVEYVDDSLKINSAPLTIVAATAVEVVGFGVELTGGSGTILMVEGDTATFKVAGAHQGISTIEIGKAGSVFPEHGIVAMAAKRSNGDMLEIDIHKAVGGGFPIALEETVFSIPELTIKLLFDTCEGKIATIRKIKGSLGACP